MISLLPSRARRLAYLSGGRTVVIGRENIFLVEKTDGGEKGRQYYCYHTFPFSPPSTLSYGGIACGFHLRCHLKQAVCMYTGGSGKRT